MLTVLTSRLEVDSPPLLLAVGESSARIFERGACRYPSLIA